jgi:peptidoglycan L-alanyl-D-glutamate endopeptidase CwlK
MTNSRDLNDLEPETRKRAIAFLEEAKKRGYRVLVTSTFRSADSQNELYAQGRTKPGRKVTNAKAGYSWHNFRMAFDLVPLTENGKADWNNLKAFRELGALGKTFGLEWGGDWSKFPDMPHFQFVSAHTLEDARKKFGLEMTKNL